MMVSICMTTYNHEKFIEESIDGVLSQKTDFDFELIIGEDCSSDKTSQLCKLYKERFPEKINLLVRPENIGMMQNFIATLKAANGKYIALCEGDDYWTDPFKLQKQVDFLEKNLDYSMVCHDVKVSGIVEQDNYIGKVKEFYSSIEFASGEISIPALSVVFRNYDLTYPDFILSCPIGDFPLLVLISEHGKIKYFPEVMGVRRVHAGGVWSAADKSKKLSYMLTTLYYMIGNYTEEINKALISYHLKLIGSSVKDGVSADYYPDEMKWVVKIMSFYSGIKKTLNKLGLYKLFRKISGKSNKTPL